MFERYTEKARRTIFFARYEASQFGGQYIETEHLLLGLLREDKELADHFFGSYTVIESIRREIEAHTPPGEKVPTSVDMPLSVECKGILAQAAEEAERLRHKDIDTQHLLVGMLREEKSYAAELLRKRGLTPDGVRQQVAQSYSVIDSPGTFVLSQYARNLTQAAAGDALNPSEAHDPTVDRVIEILWRRSKNSPVLIGENDAPKMAVVERLAFRIFERDVPEYFVDKQILAFDLPAFHVPDKYLVNELIANPNVIGFFVAPVETLFGAGLPGNPSVTSVILRPALYTARLQCIWSSTANGYDNFIANDPLLKPHFEAVDA